MKLCVLGAGGRMGRLVLDQASERDGIDVTGAVDAEGAACVGTEVLAGVTATSDLHAALGSADVYVNFTVPAATVGAAKAAAELSVAGVIGTTGLTDSDRTAIEALSKKAPVVFAPNFSLGVNVLFGLAEMAARALGADFDIEVVEMHHKHKRDAPSGTAIALGEALARGRGDKLSDVARYERAGDVGARPAGEIGVFAVRGGGIPGEHTAFLIGEDERVEITHRAASRAIFAAGAVTAAAWVHGKPPGLYGMKDVLGL